MFVSSALGKITNYLRKSYQLLVPHYCVICRNATQELLDICHYCKTFLPIIKFSCVQCGLPLSTQNLRCGDCLKNSPAFDHVLTLGSYQFPLDDFIIQLKFHHKLMYSRLLGELIACHIKSNAAPPLPDYLIPMPLHAKRLRQRGFNQALEIAKPISYKLKIPIDTTHCIRTRDTTSQTLMSARERKKNLRRAFYIDPSFTPQHIAIIDDVITTGETISALSKALKKNGVKKISVWACARTIKTLQQPMQGFQESPIVNTLSF